MTYLERLELSQLALNRLENAELELAAVSQLIQDARQERDRAMRAYVASIHGLACPACGATTSEEVKHDVPDIRQCLQCRKIWTESESTVQRQRRLEIALIKAEQK